MAYAPVLFASSPVHVTYMFCIYYVLFDSVDTNIICALVLAP